MYVYIYIHVYIYLFKLYVIQKYLAMVLTKCIQ